MKAAGYDSRSDRAVIAVRPELRPARVATYLDGALTVAFDEDGRSVWVEIRDARSIPELRPRLTSDYCNPWT